MKPKEGTNMKTGIVDVGGGMRGIYACGVMDYCLEHKINFNLGIGVSAGAANICTFIAGQKGRNYVFYTDYNQRKESMSLSNLIKKGSYIVMEHSAMQMASFHLTLMHC